MSTDLAVQHKEARSLILALRERAEQLEKAERVRVGEARACCVRSAHKHFTVSDSCDAPSSCLFKVACSGSFKAPR